MRCPMCPKCPMFLAPRAREAATYAGSDENQNLGFNIGHIGHLGHSQRDQGVAAVLCFVLLSSDIGHLGHKGRAQPQNKLPWLSEQDE